MADPTFWPDLEARFQALHNEQLQDTNNAGLHALWRSNLAPGGPWYLGGGPDDIRTKFEWLAESAAVQLGHPGGRNAVFFWLDLLKCESPHYKRCDSSHVVKGKETRWESGTIELVCKASAEFCLKCETRETARFTPTRRRSRRRPKGKLHFPLSEKKRFAVGAKVRVNQPGVNGVVTKVDDELTALGEYWHTIQTMQGERREPGCNLKLVPRPITNSEAGATKLTQNIHLHGDNPRINVNSADNSLNIASASTKNWSQLRQSVEAYKKIKELRSGPHEEIPEALVRRVLAQQYDIKPEEVTWKQIAFEVSGLLPYYPAIRVVPSAPGPAVEEKLEERIEREREKNDWLAFELAKREGKSVPLRDALYGLPEFEELCRQKKESDERLAALKRERQSYREMAFAGPRSDKRPPDLTPMGVLRGLAVELATDGKLPARHDPIQEGLSLTDKPTLAVAHKRGSILNVARKLSGTAEPTPVFTQSDDCRTVCLRGQPFVLTAMQGAAIKVLDEARLKGTPDVATDYLLEKIGARSSRLRDIFRSRPRAWKALVKRTGVGLVKLNL